MTGDIRFVIDAANTLPGADTVTVALPPQTTITLTQGQLLITQDLTITGPGRDLLAISGNGTSATGSRVFEVFTGPTVSISGLSITNGNGSPTAINGSGSQGGNIFNGGNLTLFDVAVNRGGVIGASGGAGVDGSSAQGGGIFNDAGGTLTVVNSNFSENLAVGGNGGNGSAGGGQNGGAGGSTSGGAIFSLGTLSISGSSIFLNTALGGTGGVGGTGVAELFPAFAGDGGKGGRGGDSSGGAVAIAGGKAVIFNSLINSNFVSGAGGGAGGNGGNGTLDGGHGGSGGNAGELAGTIAVTAAGAELTLSNSTLTQNVTSTFANAGKGGNAGSGGLGADGGTGGNGGRATAGVFVSLGSVTVTNSTIADQIVRLGAAGTGGTLFGDGTAGAAGIAGTGTGGFFVASGTAKVGNTIIARNTMTGVADVGGAFVTLGHNLIGVVGTATGFNGTDKSGVTADQLKLSTLKNNGGVTESLALLSGSIAIDAGDNAIQPTNGISAITSDQRGGPFTRGVGTIDIGAYEFRPAVTPTVTLNSNLNPSDAGRSVTFTAIVAGTNGLPIQGTVTFFDGATALGAPVALGVIGATFATDGLTPGAHSITAQYNGFTQGDFQAFAASTSAPLIQWVNAPAIVKQTPVGTLTSSANPSTVGQSVTFTATISAPPGGSGTPTGSVTFSIDGINRAPVTLDASGRATLTVSDLAAGSLPISALYAGDGAFIARLTTLVQPVLKQTPVVTLTSSANPSTVGQSVTFTATISAPSDGSGTPTGSVTFSINGINRTPVNLDASGRATLTVSDLSVGTHKITALYNGDANFNLNLSDDLTQSVIPPRSGDQNKVKIYAVVDSTSTSVQLFDGNGKLVGTVPSPLGTSSVRAATADITGDGVPDIVFVAGPGGAPTGAIVDGRSNTVVRMFDLFEASFTGGAFVGSADFDGDGRSDIVVSADVNGGPVVKIFSGVDGSEMAAFFGIEDPNFRGGARVATGDINGDGTPDLLVAAGFGGGPRIAIYDGKSLRPGMKPVKLLPDFFVFEETLRNGVFISSGDLNNDGFAEVIVAGGPGGGPRVFALSGKELITAGNSVQVANFFAGDPNNRNGVRVTVKDLDGDNRADLVTGGEGSVSAFAGSGIPTDGTPTGMLNAPALQGLMGGIAVG